MIISMPLHAFENRKQKYVILTIQMTAGQWGRGIMGQKRLRNPDIDLK